LVPVGSLETERVRGEARGADVRGEERGNHPLLKCSETKRWRQELLKSKWPHVGEQIALGKILTAKNITEQKTLGTIS